MIHFAARPFSSMSSGVCKYFEILALFELVPKLRDLQGSIHALADGSGGCLTTLMMVLPEKDGVYNTLIRADVDHRDVVTDWMPPAYVSSGLDIQRLRYQKLAVGQTDLLSDEMRGKIEVAVTERPPVIVTMDAESSDGMSNIDIIVRVLPIYLANNCPLAIMKIFIHDRGVMDSAISLVSSFPKYTYHFYKPVGSPQSSNEFLLVCILDRMVSASSMERAIRCTDPIKESTSLDNGNVDKYLRLCADVSSCIKTIQPTHPQ